MLNNVPAAAHCWYGSDPLHGAMLSLRVLPCLFAERYVHLWVTHSEFHHKPIVITQLASF